MAGMDMRGFSYALEPARKRRQWQFDASLARLAGVRRQIQAVEAERDAVQQLCATEAARATRAWTERRDTATQEHALLFLSALRRREEELRRELEALALTLQTARRLCAETQRQLEALDQHRTDALHTYGAEQHRKAIVEADDEWSARAARNHLGENEHG